MKKRQIIKNRKKKAYKFIQQIENELNTQAEFIRFGSGYFIIEFGANTVCHFSLSDIPDWRFAFWQTHREGVVSFFADVEVLIDKFKPTRAPFSYKFCGDVIPHEIIAVMKEMLKDGYGPFKEYAPYQKEEVERLKVQRRAFLDAFYFTQGFIESFNESQTKCNLKLEKVKESIFNHVRNVITFYGDEDLPDEEFQELWEEALEYFKNVITKKQEEFVKEIEKETGKYLHNEYYDFN